MTDLRRCSDLGMNLLLGFEETLTEGMAAGAHGSVGIAQNFIGALEVEIADKY